MVLRLRIQFCMTIFGSSLLYLAMSVIEIKSSCVPSPTTQICTPSAVMCPLICLSILAPFQTKIRQISHCQPSFHIEHMFVLIISETNICSSLDLHERRKTRRARSTWLRAPQKLASQNVTKPVAHSARPPKRKNALQALSNLQGASGSGTAHPVRRPTCSPAAGGGGLAGRCLAAAVTCLRRHLPHRRQPQLRASCDGRRTRRQPRRQQPTRRCNPARSQPRGWTRPRRQRHP